MHLLAPTNLNTSVCVQNGDEYAFLPSTHPSNAPRLQVVETLNGAERFEKPLRLDGCFKLEAYLRVNDSVWDSAFKQSNPMCSLFEPSAFHKNRQSQKGLRIF